jgi:hypothetical protein
VAHTYDPSYSRETAIRRIMVRSQLRQIGHKSLCAKYSTQKRDGKVAQMVESLPNKHEALSSNPNIEKKKV